MFSEGQFSECILNRLAMQVKSELNRLDQAGQCCEFVCRLRKSVIISPSVDC